MPLNAEFIESRTPDPWKVRWCLRCGRYEYDGGVPRGWVPLKGDAPRVEDMLPQYRRPADEVT